MAVPDNVVSNATVAERAGVTERWIVHRTGVRERRHVSQGERLSDLAVAAGRAALDEAGIRPDEVDMVLVACLAPDELTPNTAPLVAHELGAHGAGAMDVGAACTGYLSALSLATAQIECGRCENVLVIGPTYEAFRATSRPRHPARSPTARRHAGDAANGGGGRVGPIILKADGLARSPSGSHERQSSNAGHDTLSCRTPSLRSRPGRRGAAGLELDASASRLPPGHPGPGDVARSSTETERVTTARRYGNPLPPLPIAMADSRARDARAGNNVVLALRRGLIWARG